MSAPVEVKVPDIGDFADVPVIEVLVKDGDTVEVETPLITLETEKATLDVPSTAAGRILAVKIAKGDKVSKGDVIAVVESDTPAAEAAAPPSPPAVETPKAPAPEPPAARAAPASKAPPQPDTAPPPAEPPPARGQVATQPEAKASPAAQDRPAHASPSVRKFARELGVALERVSGTGLKGRITHDDVKSFVKKALAGAPAGADLPRVPPMDFSKFGPVEVQPLGRIQRVSGPRLHASWVNVPHVTQFDRADITELEETRARLKERASQQGIKLTPLAFVIRACAKTLKEFPLLNTSLDASGENLVFKKYLHIGFAVDTPGGLVVPVIRDADRKDVYELARELGELSAKARAGKLSAAEMQGGCFSISSLGSIGGTAFTPIVNAPEVAILGVSRAEHQPVYREGGFVPRLMLPLSLSYDHRVVDGAVAVRFTTLLAQTLSDARGLLEAIP